MHMTWRSTPSECATHSW